MKTLKFFAIAALALFAAASCDKEVFEPEVSMTSTEIVVSVDGATQPVSFSANADWTISADVEWISFDKTEGNAGDITVKVTVAANEDYTERTGTVTITCDSKTSTIKFVQKFVESFDAVVSYNVDSKAQQIVYEVSANIAYKAVVDEDAKGWLEAAVTKAAPTDGKIVIGVSANTGLYPREGKVAIIAGNVTTCLVIKQGAEFENMYEARASYNGRTSDIYDSSVYSYLYYDEYVITLANEDSELILALNTAVHADAEAAIPAGEYVADAAATRGDLTFSLKNLNNAELPYTTIVDKNSGEEKLFIDGQINIEEDGGVYTIVATLMDEHENILRYSYQGEIAEIADNSYGWNLYESAYKNTYETHFASKANSWGLGCHISKGLNNEEMAITYFSATIYGPAGEVADLNAIPYGTYTIVNEIETLELPYENGKLNAQPFTAQAIYCTLTNPCDPEVESTYGYITEGTITIEAGEAGKTKITINGTDGYWYNDENEETLTYSGSGEVLIQNTTDNQIYPQEDGDGVFTNSTMGSWSAFYIGDAYEQGFNTMIVSMTYLGGVYNVTFTINDDGSYEFENDIRNNYCSKAPTVGKYTYSETAGEFTIIPIAQTFSAITNTYTGTVYKVCGGTVEFTGTSTVFNIQGKDNNGNVATFTGTITSGMQAMRNMSTNATYKRYVTTILVP